MKLIRRILFFSAALLPCSLMGAENITLSDILIKMEEAEKNVKSVRFRYNQNVTYTLTNEKQSNSGEITYMKPDKIYMKQLTPIEQVIVSDGIKIWIYTPSYSQVVKDRWDKWINSGVVPNSLLNFSQDWAELKAKYTFTLEGRENDYYVILLTPLKDEIKFRFWVDVNEFIPKKILLIQDNVQVMVSAEDYEINPAVDKKLFNFQPPSGVDVLSVP